MNGTYNTNLASKNAKNSVFGDFGKSRYFDIFLVEKIFLKSVEKSYFRGTDLTYGAHIAYIWSIGELEYGNFFQLLKVFLRL